MLSLVATLLVKTALKSGRGAAERALEEELFSEEELEDILKPEHMTSRGESPLSRRLESLND